MTGNKLKTQLIAGMMLWGLFMSFPMGTVWAQTLDGNEQPISQQSFEDGSSIEISRKTNTEEDKNRLIQEKREAASEMRDILAEAEDKYGSWISKASMARLSKEGKRKRMEKLRERALKAGDIEMVAKIDQGMEASLEAQEKRYAGRQDEYTEMTYTDPQGKPKKVILNDDMEAVAGVMKGCQPIMLKLSEARNCIFCPLFIVLANTAQTMTKASYDALASGFVNVMLLAFALFVGFITLKQVSSFTKQDGPKYVTELLTLSFKVLLAYYILTHIQELYDLILTPLLKAGIEFGSAFLFHSPNGIDIKSCVDSNVTQIGSEKGIQIADGYFRASLFIQVDCFIRAVLQELAVPQALGSSLMCVATHDASHWYGLPDISMLLSGFFTWLFAWLVCLAFAFYLIDAVVRLGIVGGLMPFLIAAWPFKVTSKYTTKGWNMFMNSFFTFVFLGLVVSVNVELGSQALTGGKGKDGFDTIMSYMNQDMIKPLAEAMSIGLIGLLFLVLCSVFGFKLCAEAITLAQSMSEAQGGNIGSKLGSDAAGASKKLATGTAKTAWKGAKAGGGALAHKTGAAQWANRKADGVRSKANALGAKFGQKLGFMPKPDVGDAGGGDGGAGGGGGGGGAGGEAANQQAAAPNTAAATAGAEATGANTKQAGQTANSAGTNAAAQNGAGGNGGAGGQGALGSNGAAGGQNEQPGTNDNEPTTGEQNGDAPNGQNGAVSDGGAANAGPRGENSSTDSAGNGAHGNGATEAAVNEAKGKIAAGANTAATNATVNNSKKKDDKNKKKAEQRIKELEQQLKQAKQELSSRDTAGIINVNELEAAKRKIAAMEVELQQVRSQASSLSAEAEKNKQK